MTLIRQLRQANLERWYMYPGSVYEGEGYKNTDLEVFIWEEEGEIYILTITDVPKELLFSNEDLVSDIESLAHHLVVEKGSTQLWEFYEIDASGFKEDPNSEETVECQLLEYQDMLKDEYIKEYIYPKYPLQGYDKHQKTFKY